MTTRKREVNKVKSATKHDSLPYGVELKSNNVVLVTYWYMFPESQDNAMNTIMQDMDRFFNRLERKLEITE